MNAKELLQMSATMEQFVAFTSLMKGELNTEIQAAKQALQDLDDAQDLVVLKASLDKDKTSFELYKQEVQEHFKDQYAALTSRVVSLDTREEALTAAEKKLATDQGDLQVAQNALAIARQQFADDQAKAQQALKEAQEALDADRANVSAAQHSIIVREQEVNRKLDVLRNL